MNAQPPPGWYPDPGYANTQRYWNGLAWTDSRHPPLPTPPNPAGDDESDWLLGIGYLTSLLLPVLGFVLGAIVLIRGKATGHGLAILLISVAVGFAACAFVVDDAEEDLDKLGQELQQESRELDQELRRESNILDRELDADAELAQRSILTNSVDLEGDVYVVELEKTTGFLGSDPAKVCGVMREEGYMPATVTVEKTDETFRC